MWICFVTEPAKLYFDVIVYGQGCKFIYLLVGNKFKVASVFCFPLPTLFSLLTTSKNKVFGRGEAGLSKFDLLACVA